MLAQQLACDATTCQTCKTLPEASDADDCAFATGIAVAYPELNGSIEHTHKLAQTHCLEQESCLDRVQCLEQKDSGCCEDPSTVATEKFFVSNYSDEVLLQSSQDVVKKEIESPTNFNSDVGHGVKNSNLFCYDVESAETHVGHGMFDLNSDQNNSYAEV